MHLASSLTVAFSIFSATSASPLFTATAADSPALTWHVSDFDVGCSPGGCVYSFNIYGIGTANTPAFNTTCSGTDVQGGYAKCEDGNVLSQLVPELYPTWNVKAQHKWRQGNFAEFYALGQVNITSGTTTFTIPVTEVYGVA